MKEVKKKIDEMTLKELYEEKKRLLFRPVGTSYNYEQVKEIDKLILKLQKEKSK